MDKNEHSIFAYVMDQLDENGIYQGGALIDDPTPSLPRPLGSDDAYIYTAEMPPDLPGAEAVCSMLLAYADEPSATAKAVLEEALIKILCVSVCDPLVELLSEDEVPEPLLALAEDWLYTAHKRELVKYAEKRAKETGYSKIIMHAMLSVVSFYERLGYHQEGDIFEEKGITFVRMVKNL